MTTAGGDAENHGFPAVPPRDLPWRWRSAQPILGPEAEADLRSIRSRDRRLARRLTEAVVGLLDWRSSEAALPIPDPPGVGPRYAVDLGDGYAGVCWPLRPPPEHARDGAVIWVERVVTWDSLLEAIGAMEPES